MINNRQNGRRRGRGGTQPGNNNNRPNRPEQGNRIDNRARGNANQLHDKYKALARDAQMQGDRVLTEYYLQFADHYFRVLSESRARFEEQRRPRDESGQDYDRDSGQDDGDNAFDDDFRTADAVYRGLDNAPRATAQDQGDVEGGEDRDQRQPQRTARDDRGPRDDRPQRDDRQQRDDRAPRQDRGYQDRAGGDRPDREPRPDRTAPRADRPVRELRIEIEPRREQPATAPVAESAVSEAIEQAPRRRGRPRREERVEAASDDAPAERIEPDRLPPAVGAPSIASVSGEDAVEAPRKRRVRRPRVEDDEAPVAA